jgi:hypothetical protein
MSDWIQVKGFVKEGYGVASGRSGNPRFPQGTVEMQKAFFRERGLDLDEYYPGTINLSISPLIYEVKHAKYIFKNVRWSQNDPAEDFSFFDCRILTNSNGVLSGLIYYPHPETKPEHFQSSDVLEIITSFIGDLRYGDELTIEIDSQQIEIS